MPAEIKSPLPPMPYQGVTADSTRQGRQQHAQKTRLTQTDSVRFSNAAKKLQQWEQVIRHAPVVDMKKVQLTRDALADGSYRANDERTASKLIHLEHSIYS